MFYRIEENLEKPLNENKLKNNIDVNMCSYNKSPNIVLCTILYRTIMYVSTKN